MHREIDRAREQRLLDLLGEQPLAAGLATAAGPGCGRPRCGSRRSRSRPRSSHARRERRARHARLRERERAAARADAQSGLRHGTSQWYAGANSLSARAWTSEMLVLGIETTCDETAAAVVRRDEDGRGEILSNIVLSQTDEHAPYGGVVPEIAARAHVEVLDTDHRQGDDRGERRASTLLDGVAAAAGPGLIGGVIVGLTTAKAIALVRREAADRGQSSRSACADRAAHRRRPRSPIACSSPPAATPRSSRCSTSATTCGSAPRSTMRSARPSTRPRSCSASPIRAGRRSSARRSAAIRERFILPRPMLGRAEADFSLSGLKTALRIEAEKVAPLSDQDVADLCASFQQAVVDVVIDRLRAGLRMFRERFGGPTALVVAGGVAVNQSIRRALEPRRARAGHRAGRAAAGTVHRQRRDDRLGRLRAARARPDRHARRRAARALAARRRRVAAPRRGARSMTLAAHRGDRRGRVGHGARQLRGARRTRRDAVGARSRRPSRRSRPRAKTRACPASGSTTASPRPARIADVAHADAVLLAVPAQDLRTAATALAPASARHAGRRLRQGHRARHAPLHDRGDRRDAARTRRRRSSPARASRPTWRAACRPP